MIRLSGKGEVNPPNISSLHWDMDFHTLSTCAKPRDTVIVVRNIGCDTVKIVSGPGNLPPEFTMSTVTYPVLLAPNDSILFTLTFSPERSGKFVTV